MESRKYQLQKQIIEALKANDNNLYSLLKSQWAHRFGVESLEELNNLDLKQLNQNSTNVDNQKIDQSLENFLEGDNSVALKEDDNQEKEKKDEVIESVNDEINASFKVKSYEIIDKKNYKNQAINQIKEIKSQPEFEALIPLPPKPKYGYLRKWLLKNKYY
ncbi:hypothetical protein [Prochlorococcus marinus]|uniref:hypothetical protein n=1 Tax=Prochlorococcus marinus TaxID=1219 RepID=UPI0022B4EB30|nr:hypothetical protein [Prochlorococcus marinus]